MHAFILAGGLGTRLRPYTHSIPKPLMPLGDRSILDILLVNGDTLTDLDFAELMARHREKGAVATIFAPTIEDRVDYGVLVSDDNGALTDYVEKPVRRLEVSSGVYALSRRALDFIPAGERFDMPQLVRAGSDPDRFLTRRER